ncbi:melanopsin-like [Paramuricea clavata]|uniref:Melanopsin-like n=1 Tax=Paramuricea clavata TaxID=317549 RepID=A0A7D9DWB7_PARCT|nr:melanopsin-like [Paramuricea clavata]
MSRVYKGSDLVQFSPRSVEFLKFYNYKNSSISSRSYSEVFYERSICTDMEQSQVSEPVATILGFVFAVIVCFGGVTNALVLITHTKYHKELLKDSKDILTFSLAFGDLVMSIIVTPLALSSAVARKWTTGRNGCVIYGLMTTWIGLSSILQLTCIAVERCYTLSSLNASNTSRKRATQMIAGCWLISFLASSLPLFGFSQFTLEGYGLHCSIVWKNSHVWYCLFLLLFFYALPITTIAISYAKMFLIVRRVYRNAAVTWGANAQATRKSYTAQVKFTKQLVVVTCGFLIAWTPYAIMSGLRVLSNIEFENGWYELPALFAKTANIYNPIIYFLMYRRLRRHVSMCLGEAWKKVFQSW